MSDEVSLRTNLINNSVNVILFIIDISLSAIYSVTNEEIGEALMEDVLWGKNSLITQIA